MILGVFFVVQSSQRKSIRTLHTGETVMSTVRRPGAHRAYIREVSKQTTIVRLQGNEAPRSLHCTYLTSYASAGFLFFGTITHVEETIRTLVEGPSWQRNPIRFLILDLTLVAGVDMSAAEAFVRVQRLLASRRVMLVFCGFSLESNVGRSLGNVDLLEMEGVEVFATFSDALECGCLFDEQWWEATDGRFVRDGERLPENVVQQSENGDQGCWYVFIFSSLSLSFLNLAITLLVLPGRQVSSLAFEEAVAATPRNMELIEAGWRTIARGKLYQSRMLINSSSSRFPCRPLATGCRRSGRT